MVKCLAQGHKRRDQAGIRTHILITSELESNALDRSATTLSTVYIHNLFSGVHLTQIDTANIQT